jgi:DNA-binding transcriptional ArsR family regulator
MAERTADDSAFDRLFGAFADATRRRVVQALAAEQPQSTTQLARRFPTSRWAVMKHLAVLREAGIIQTFPQGRRRLHFLAPDRLAAARRWLPPGERTDEETRP